jgi:hypothetical protein
MEPVDLSTHVKYESVRDDCRHAVAVRSAVRNSASPLSPSDYGHFNGEVAQLIYAIKW